jgi:hypothetical protein
MPPPPERRERSPPRSAPAPSRLPPQGFGRRKAAPKSQSKGPRSLDGRGIHGTILCTLCRSGGTGRRARFRTLSGQPGGGSSPLFGTTQTTAYPWVGFFVSPAARPPFVLSAVQPHTKTRYSAAAATPEQTAAWILTTSRSMNRPHLGQRSRNSCGSAWTGRRRPQSEHSMKGRWGKWDRTTSRPHGQLMRFTCFLLPRGCRSPTEPLLP